MMMMLNHDNDCDDHDNDCDDHDEAVQGILGPRCEAWLCCSKDCGQSEDGSGESEIQ